MSDKGHIDTGNALDRTENLAQSARAPDGGDAEASSAETTVRKARKAAPSIAPRSSKSAPPRISVAPLEPKGRPSRSIPATKVPRTRRSIAPTLPSNEHAADLAAPASTSSSDAADSPRLDAGVRDALPAASPANVIVSEAAQAEDQVSIPPATSDVAENGAQTFTSPAISATAKSDAAARATIMALRPAGATTPELDAADAYEAQLGNRLSRERRAKSQKYVKAVVVIAAVVCLAAVARVGIARMGRPQAIAHAASATEPAAAAAPAPAEELPVAEPEVLPAASVDDKAIGDKTAGEEKKAALGALERRKLDEAIAAGERSVALDPSDGDAWRILGAAYQDSGRIADAHRCYSECTKHGKKGEIRECSFLLSK